MLLKNVALAFAAMVLTTGSVFAGDLMDDLKEMDVNSLADAGAEVEEFDLGAVDVDKMAGEAGADSDSDAIEACFRRFGGYSHGGWNTWCGYHNYNYSYNNCYSYAYSCYQPSYYCYRPIVSCYTHCYPVVTSYWGCY